MIQLSKEAREAFQRDELKNVWERKCVSFSPAAIAGRRQKALNRLLVMGIESPTKRDIERQVEAILEEKFIPWLASKRATGFDRV